MDSPAEFFQILSDSTRLRILLLLDKRELCVCQLLGALGMSQPRVSQQLAVLKHANLVISSREGNWIYYGINPKLTEKDKAKEILNRLPKWLKDDETAKSDGLALRACLKQQETTGNCDIKSFVGVREKFVNK